MNINIIQNVNQFHTSIHSSHFRKLWNQLVFFGSNGIHSIIFGRHWWGSLIVWCVHYIGFEQFGLNGNKGYKQERSDSSNLKSNLFVQVVKRAITFKSHIQFLVFTFNAIIKVFVCRCRPSFDHLRWVAPYHFNHTLWMKWQISMRMRKPCLSVWVS